MDSKEILKISLAFLATAGITYLCIKEAKKRKRTKKLAVYIV